MTQEQVIAEVSHALGLLTQKVRSENLAGLFSANRIAEDILLPVFRIAFEAPGLRNANTERTNAPDIDLEDPSTRLAIQVSSERSSGKVTDTLVGFLSRNRDQSFARLVVFILADSPLRPNGSTKARWAALCDGRLAFDPDRDVLTLSELLSRLTGLPFESLLAIQEVLAKSIVGKRYIDFSALLLQQAQQQLETEKRATKYIPDIFVETRDTKYLARCFSHPQLFLQRVREEVQRLPLSSLSEELVEAGLSDPMFPSVPERAPIQSLGDAAEIGLETEATITALHTQLETFKNLSRSPPAELVSASRRHVYRERHYQLTTAAQSLQYKLARHATEVAATGCRFFVLIGKAGQGKTNFVCDFVERFLWKHEVPCAYLSGRALRNVHGIALAETVAYLMLGVGTSFADAAERLSEQAERSGMPCVVVIDGINEHTHPDFATQLEQFLLGVLRYPHLRVLMTCRSEFFEARFGRLFRKVLEKETLIIEGAPFHQREARNARLIEGYYSFFGLSETRIASQVTEALVSDLLLLRFFCEAYGTRGKPPGYRQPAIASIHRDDIFELYLKEKLTAGDDTLRLQRGQTVNVEPAESLGAVLELVVKYMVDHWQFGNVPRSVVPERLLDALVVLLDEDVILREDSAPQGVFGTGADTLNFTFDELRDYLVAEYLVARVYAQAPERFAQLLSQSTPQGTPSLEGLKRFLFYKCRKELDSSFGVTYARHSWYEEAYDDEVFNIPAALLTSDDAAKAEAILSAGETRAISFARALAVKWRASACPHLNLGRLLSFALGATDEQYRATIVPAFESRGYQEDGLSGSLVKFVMDRILPGFVPGQDEDELSLFRLLAILLPIGGTYNLNSATLPALRALGEQHPRTAVNVLTWALGARSRSVAPYAWRLLREIGLEPGEVAVLAPLARTASATEPPGSQTSREIERFLASIESRRPGGVA